MTTFLIAFTVMVLAVTAMAVGVMISGREIKGSCGGLNNVDGAECACGSTCEATGETRESGPRRMLHSVTVRDYMSANLVTFTAETDVLRAIHLLLENGITGAPVVDNLGNLVGYLSEKDCLEVALDASYHEEWGGKVGEYMTPEIITVEQDANILQVARIFRNTSIKAVPVMDDNRVVGRITRSDVLRAFEAIR